MKIGELSRRSGLSVDTLRYYEKLGLIDPPWREGGWRSYDSAIIVWVTFLKMLKATGMPLSDIEAYARLRRRGDETSAARREMLERQRARVREKIAELSECAQLLDHKIDNYARIEARHRAQDEKGSNRHER